MRRKKITPAQIIPLVIVILMILSCFAGAVNFASAQTTNYPAQTMGSSAEIAALENTVEANGGWNSSFQTIYDGIVLGQTTVSQLQNAVDSIDITSTSAAETVFYWYFELSKFGVPINATTVEAALDAVTMLPNVGGVA